MPPVAPSRALNALARELLSLVACATLAAACAPLPPPAPPPAPIVAAPPVAPPPAPPPPPVPPPPQPLSELTLATQRAFFDALRSHDEAALAHLYAPDAAIYVGLGVAEAHGPDAAATLAKTFWEAFPDVKIQWSNLLQSGNAVAVELAWTGTQTSPLAGLVPARPPRVVGSHALLLERFAPNGLLQAQHLYFDKDALESDLASRGAKPHAFDGLPTSQSTVLDHAVATAEDDAAMRGLAASFMRGAFADVRGLGLATSAWVDRTKGHTVSGKSAIPAWVSFLEHTFKGGGKQLMDVWSTGEWVVLEWSSSSGSAPDAGGAHAAELVLFDGGHIAEVRSYRSSTPNAHPARADR